jgi:amino acid transporter
MTERTAKKSNSKIPPQGTLSTFSGVFTPSILTILGIILFLRLGYVVGNAGLGRALIIIGLANAISVLTSFSLSAIATNLMVKGGGDYYLISRTLGVEFGGAIGIVLFLAQSVSIAFYCIGFGEAVAGMLPEAGKSLPQIVAALAVAFLFIFAWLGADWATRFQYVVMAVLAAALVSFFVGGLAEWDTATLVQSWASPASGSRFWILFAIFFPAVTGFTQGVSMSGDLKDAGRSLPLGTFLAVGISIIIYFGAAVVFAAALPGNVLAGEYGAMKRVAVLGFLINAGVIAATLSSAMASFLGAPRILQSMAGDRIFPFLLPFAKGSGSAANPRKGVLLSTGIAFATIGLGKLNIIAPVVSMFFLISYGLLNYATFFEARAASPSFRPTFKWFDSRLSLLGFLACLGAMLAINLSAGAVAIAILFAIHQYLKRTSGPARWADSRRSYHLQRVRENLLSAALEPEHPRDWRPQILAFSNDSRRRGQLLQFASWLEGGSGITTAVRILEGEGMKMLKLKEEAEEELRRDIDEHGLKAFPLVVVAPKLHIGVQILVQGFGVGPLKVNTILLNWLDRLSKGMLGLGEIRYGRNLRAGFRFGSNIVILDANEDEWIALEEIPPQNRRIDVWWWDDSTSHLMLLFAYLMTRSHFWDGAKIRVLAASSGMETKGTLEKLQKTLQEVRIEAEPIIVEKINEDKIAEHSADSAMVFFPFRLSGNQLVSPIDVKIDSLISRLSIVTMVLAAKDIELDAEPEEGTVGEVASAIDFLADAEKKAREMEKEAEAVAKEAEEKLNAVESAIASASYEDLKSKIKAASESKEKALKAARRAAKASVKAEDAAREAEKLGANIEKRDKTSEKESNDPGKSK